MLRRCRGFNLIELLIALAIVAMLAVIAFPAYQEQLRKSRRSDGQALLLDIAARLDRFFYQNGTYSADLTELGYTVENVPSAGNHYRVSVLAPDETCELARCYLLQAVPQGSQADDGLMQLSSTGIKRRDKNRDNDVDDPDEDSWL